MALQGLSPMQTAFSGLVGRAKRRLVLQATAVSPQAVSNSDRTFYQPPVWLTNHTSTDSEHLVDVCNQRVHISPGTCMVGLQPHGQQQTEDKQWHPPSHAAKGGRLGREMSYMQQPRLLTAKLSHAKSVSDLLLLLGQNEAQLDSIHVSAAVKQACRVLGLQLDVPTHLAATQAQYAKARREEQLQWLHQISAVSLQPRLHQLPQELDMKQGQFSTQGHEQQQAQLQKVVDQQQELHMMVQQQLTRAAPVGLKQQGLPQSLSRQLPSDSWLLLLLVSRLVQHHASRMQEQQLCACLNGLTHLLLQHPELPLLALQHYRSALQQLVTSAQIQLPNMRPKALALVLYSAATIARSPHGLGPSNRFMKQWFRHSRSKLSVFSPLDLSMSVWSLGRLQVYPPSQWMTEFWTISKAAVPAMQAQELLMMLYGIAYVEPVPRLSTTATAARSGWLPAVTQQLQQHLAMLQPKQLSALMVAFARLKYTPPAEWQREYERAWDAAQCEFTPAGQVCVLWGVGFMPPAAGQQDTRVAWARKLQHALQAAVTRAASAVAAVALLKLRQAAQQQQRQGLDASVEQMKAPLNQQPGSQQEPLQQLSVRSEDETQLQTTVMDQYADQLQAAPEQPQLLASGSLLHPTDCAMAIAALARLGPTAIEQEFASFWLKQSRSQLCNMNSAELSVCLHSLGKLKLRPPGEWLQQAMACCAQQAACLTHQQLAMVFWGCARLQYLPNVLVTAELLMSAAEQLPAFTSHSLALMMWSLGVLHLKPNKEWMQLVLRQARRRFRRFDSQDLYCLLLGLYRLRYNPGEQWLEAYAKVMASKIDIITPANHHVIVSVLKTMGYSWSGKPYAWAFDETAVALLRKKVPEQRHHKESHPAFY